MRRHPSAPALGKVIRRVFVGAALGGTAIAGLGAAAFLREAAPTPPRQEEVETVTFDTAEWPLVIALGDVLVPFGGDGPGALEARVPVVIDRLLDRHRVRACRWYSEGLHGADADPFQPFQLPPTPGELYHRGLARFHGRCRPNHDAGFVDFDGDARNAATTALMDKETGLPPELRDFPEFQLENVKPGYPSDPRHGSNHARAAWNDISLPGARNSFLTWTDPKRDGAPSPLGPVSVEGERGRLRARCRERTSSSSGSAGPARWLAGSSLGKASKSWCWNAGRHVAPFRTDDILARRTS